MMAVRRQPFTLFEVVLALIIISISVVATLGVFPIGMRMHNNAMQRSQAADIAEEILSLAALKARNGITFPTSSLSTVKTTSALNIRSQSPTWDKQSSEVDGLIDSKYYYYNGGSFNDGIIRVHRTHTAYRGDAKVEVTELDVVFAIFELTDSVARDVDVSDKLPYITPLTSANSQYTDDRDVTRIAIEASWPGSWEYEKRKKMTLVTEVLR